MDMEVTDNNDRNNSCTFTRTTAQYDDDDPGSSSTYARNDHESNLLQRSHIAIIQMAPPAHCSTMNAGTYNSQSQAVSGGESEVKVVRTVSPSKRQKAGVPRPPRESSSSSKKKRHYCSVQGCTYNTPHTKDLARHMRKHTGEKPFNCDRCSKSFTRYDKLVMHIRIHEGHRPFSCKLCDYAATDSSSLRKHLRTHSDERPYKCHLCPYSSKDSSQLIVHLRHHTGDSPYVCAFAGCDAAFKTPSDLSRHNRLHTGEKPFKCSFCNYRAAVKSNLNVHMRRHTDPKPKNGRKGVVRLANYQTNDDNDDVDDTLEKESVSIPVPLKASQEVLPFQYACKLCEHKSDTIDLFNAHMEESHPDSGLTVRLDSKPAKGRPPKKLKDFAEDLRKFQCHSCNAAFKCENSLRCHMRQHGTVPNKPANVDPQIYTPRVHGNIAHASHSAHRASGQDEPGYVLNPPPTYSNEVQMEDNYSLHEMQRMPLIQSVITENPTVMNASVLENGSGAHIIKHHYDPTTGHVYAVAYENVELNDHLAL